jgi:hypothetical protein
VVAWLSKYAVLLEKERETFRSIDSIRLGNFLNRSVSYISAKLIFSFPLVEAFIMDSPRTVRRVSLSRREPEETESEVVESGPITEAEWNEFSGFTRSLKERLDRSFGKAINTFKTKIAGATDPSFPRSEVIQQLKQTAMSMYTASEFIAKEVCDVADDAVLIYFCFSIGAQSLIQETLRILKIDMPQEEVDKIVLEVLNGVKNKRSTKVSFTDVDIEPYVRRLVVAFGIDKELLPASPPPPAAPGVTIHPKPVAAELRARTPPKHQSPEVTGRSPKPTTPPRTNPTQPRPVTPQAAQRLSPLRPVRGMANVDERRFLGSLSAIGLNHRYRSYHEALVEVEAASHATKAALVNFRQARINQRFSQSQGV